MGKIENKLGGLIIESAKKKEKTRADAYKNLKAKLTEFKTSPDGLKKCVLSDNGVRSVPDSEEIRIASKMVKELRDDASTFRKFGRAELTAESDEQAAALEELLPKAASPEEIEAALSEWMKAECLKKIDFVW